MDDLAEARSAGEGMTAHDIEVVYRRHFHGVLRSVLPVVGRMAVAEELVQEAFEAANREWARVSRYDRPDLWVRRVALTLAISSVRRSRRESLVAQTSETASLIGVWSPDSTAVLDALRRLPDRQLEVTVLVYFGGLWVAEAARSLEISESTARTHLRRALDALAPLLADDIPASPPAPGGV
jgi:RNA polymerase sigma factor (sigma-70 family)